MKINYSIIFLLILIMSCKTQNSALRKLSQDEIYNYRRLNASFPKDIIYIDLNNHQISYDSAIALSRKGTPKFKVDYYVDANNKIIKGKAIKATEEELKAIQLGYVKFVENTPLPTIKTHCDSLKERISLLFKQDQELRNGTYSYTKDIQIQMSAISIIEYCGWDLIERANKENIYSLFIIIQHTDKYTRNKYFKKFEEYSQKGYISHKSLALMQDRMLMDNNLPQIYGTQIIGKNGKQFIWPIQNAEQVDERRLKIGLDSLSNYLKHFGLVYPDDLYNSN
ncbi:MAG: hypothetical protein JNL70_25135 [Saprospiraceae bacterium]|nr:hypothetical protein [Saprospiraceae bacterium]